MGEDQEPADKDELVGPIIIKVLEEVRRQIDEQVIKIREEFTASLETAAAKAAAAVEAKGTDLVARLTEQATKATADAAAIATSKGTVEQTLAQIETLSTQCKTALDTANTHRDTVVSLGERTTEVNDEVTSLQAQVRDAKTKAEKHEAEWKKKHSDLFNTIEGLLPGATGAGLASGFREEKIAYEKKQLIATIIFAGFLVVLFWAIGWAPLRGLFGIGGTSTPSDVTGFLLKMFLNLPLVVPAAWGAWWFNRKAHTYDRLAEEYRQKEAISKAFVGYTKQLIELEQKEALSEYLVSALKEVCVPPGRIYDKKQPPGSPWEDNIDKAIDAAIKAKLTGDT